MIQKNNIAIKVENLNKAYQLGQIGTGTISRDLERWYARLRGKEDPFLRIGESNNQHIKSESNVVWSLSNINFEIEQGDAVGIIGRNGAGKSTLLKILSKVTAPTTGKISGKGRIASLLEVGTGFHPELSGRENIFLNGAILGMRKKEIERKMDEIVDFAGVERYLDTPVKRYSSGMYVRLAFAVAAHLESEILIVDEVLAVGDAEFQKKCLGKMGEVSKGEGRTVIFVSHNMGSIQQLCNSAILLNMGCLAFKGNCESTINQYLSTATKFESKSINGSYFVSIREAYLFNNSQVITDSFFLGDCMFIRLKLKFNKFFKNVEIALNIKNIFGEIISHITSQDTLFVVNGDNNEQIVEITINKILFAPGEYCFDVFLLEGDITHEENINLIPFVIHNSDLVQRTGGFPKNIKMFTPTEWKII